MSFLFPPLTGEVAAILEKIPRLIDEVFPIPARYRHGIPKDVAELSRLLTSARTERSASYLGKPALLSAYLRYFLPWNIYRLCRLLASLPLQLKPGDAVNDLGSGPLTLAASLWISRPELRSIPLEFRCLDRTSAILEAGKKFFTALTNSGYKEINCPWLIKTIRGEVKRSGSLSAEIRGKPAALTSAINFYNELYWNISPIDTESLVHFTEKQSSLLSSLTYKAGSILVLEPGIPRGGEFISLLRNYLQMNGYFPISPCPHSGACPFPGGQAKNKAKWCHFSFDTNDAPEDLHRLSAASGIPKERAVLSFLLAGSPNKVINRKDKLKIRVISDSFPLTEEISKEKNAAGRYGCSERGMVLVAGSRSRLDRAASGSLEELPLVQGKTDRKSGALIVNY